MVKVIVNMIINYMYIFFRYFFFCSLFYVFFVLDGVLEIDEQKFERVGQEVGDINKIDDDKETSILIDKLEDLIVKGVKSLDSDVSKEEGDFKDKFSDLNEIKVVQSLELRFVVIM